MASLVAGGQWGVIGWQQLLDCGFSAAAIERGPAGAKLHAIHWGVYAYGHQSVPIEGRMVAAILHAGAGTVLSHATAAWWWRLVLTEPALIDVSTPTRARSTQGVRVHHPRRIDATTQRRWVGGDPIRRWRGRAWTAPRGRRSATYAKCWRRPITVVCCTSTS